MTAMMMESGERRGPGRPRRYPRGRINAAVSLTPTRYAALRAAAVAAGRSLSEEIEHRIEKCAIYDDTLAAMRARDALIADGADKQRVEA